jgi:transposase
MTVPGIGPIISSAVVAAIGPGSGFKQGRDFAAWLGLVPKQVSTHAMASNATTRDGPEQSHTLEIGRKHAGDAAEGAQRGPARAREAGFL